MKAIAKAVVVWIAALTRINIFPWTLLSRFFGGGGIKTKWGPLSMLRSFFSSRGAASENNASENNASENSTSEKGASGAGRARKKSRGGRSVVGFLFVALAFGLVLMLVFF